MTANRDKRVWAVARALTSRWRTTTSRAGGGEKQQARTNPMVRTHSERRGSPQAHESATGCKVSCSRAGAIPRTRQSCRWFHTGTVVVAAWPNYPERRPRKHQG